ncbi:TonB-dependent receptor [Sesbania bispinosa]|nr:TonB-dependent receptor [Sesbania bispinosa]
MDRDMGLGVDYGGEPLLVVALQKAGDGDEVEHTRQCATVKRATSPVRERDNASRAGRRFQRGDRLDSI